MEWTREVHKYLDHSINCWAWVADLSDLSQQQRKLWFLKQIQCHICCTGYPVTYSFCNEYACPYPFCANETLGICIALGTSKLHPWSLGINGRATRVDLASLYFVPGRLNSHSLWQDALRTSLPFLHLNKFLIKVNLMWMPVWTFGWLILIYMFKWRWDYWSLL